MQNSPEGDFPTGDESPRNGKDNGSEGSDDSFDFAGFGDSEGSDEPREKKAPKPEAPMGRKIKGQAPNDGLKDRMRGQAGPRPEPHRRTDGPHRPGSPRRLDGPRREGPSREAPRGEGAPSREGGFKRPFDKEGGFKRPFDKEGGFKRPFDKEGGFKRPFDKEGGFKRPFDKEGGFKRPFSKEGAPPGRPFNRDGGDRGGKPWERKGPPRATGPGDRPFRGGDRRDDRPPREGRSFDRDSRPPRAPGEGFAKPYYHKKDPAFLPKEPVLHKPISDEAKEFLPLKTDKGRYKESRFLLEGIKNISDVIEISPEIMHTVLISDDFKDKDLLTLIKKKRITVLQVTPDDLQALSDTEAPQGIVAVANFGTLKIDWNLVRTVALLDAVQDPGNVGAIMRTSLALGFDAVVLGKGSCDPYNPKVVRSSVGALLRMPFETGEDLGSKINFLRQKSFTIVASSSHAKQTMEQAKLRKKVALIVGNEGAGTGANIADLADAVVKIPLKNQVESLNVAVAHGILAYQLMQGRD